MNISFRIGIGSVKNLYAQLESYNEALKSLVNSTGRVAHAEDLPLACEYEESYPIDLEKELFESITRGDVKNTIVYASRFFDWMEEAYPNSLMDIKLKVIEFVLFAENLAYKNGGMVYQFDARTEYLKVVMEAQSIGSMKQWFVGKMSDSCRNIATKREERSSSVVEKAKEYIANYYNKDVSLDDVSREVNISSYYFSKIFKEETGQNFIEYLTNIRIDKAKELLLDSECTMKQICTMVGYSDPNYFSRSFKKKVGVTPTEFKEGV